MKNRNELEIYNNSRVKENVIYWLQCPETDLDPAEKTKFHSFKLFKENNTKVKFATTRPDEQTVFPEWSGEYNFNSNTLSQRYFCDE